MAEEEQDANEEGAPIPEDSGPSRLPQFLVLILVILLGQAAAGYVLITKIYYPGISGEVPEEEIVDNPKDRPVFDIEPPQLFPLAEMILNPPDRGTIRFLSARVTLELDSADALAEFEDGLVAAKIHDLVLSILSRTKFDQMDEAPERTVLKSRLKEEINAAALLENGEVTKIYFDRFILQ